MEELESPHAGDSVTESPRDLGDGATTITSLLTALRPTECAWTGFSCFMRWACPWLHMDLPSPSPLSIPCVFGFRPCLDSRSPAEIQWRGCRLGASLALQPGMPHSVPGSWLRLANHGGVTAGLRTTGFFAALGSLCYTMVLEAVSWDVRHPCARLRGCPRLHRF